MKKKSNTMEEYVYQKIREALIRRHIRPMSRLVETSIAQQLEVSRTPVRAAIRRLNHEGIVDIQAMRGAFVVKPTHREIQDAFEIRIQLEGHAVRKALPLMKPEDYKLLEGQICEETRSFEARDFEAYQKANADFHLTIPHITGNQMLRQYISDLLDRTGIYLILFDPFYQIESNPSMEEHRQILDELEAGDEAGAVAAMTAHLEATLHGLREEDGGDNPEPVLQL